MVACKPRLSVWGYGEKIFPFPLLAIFSPFPQTESLFTGYQIEAFGAYFSHMLLRAHALLTKTLISYKHETKYSLKNQLCFNMPTPKKEIVKK